MDQKDFRITPAFFENFVSKWNPYLDNCTLEELTNIEQRANWISQKAGERWLRLKNK